MQKMKKINVEIDALQNLIQTPMGYMGSLLMLSVSQIINSQFKTLFRKILLSQIANQVAATNIERWITILQKKLAPKRETG